VPSQGEQRDAAVNFDVLYQTLQRYRVFSLPQHGFLGGFCLQTAVNAGLLSKVSEEIPPKMSSSTTPLSFDASSLNPREHPHIPYISRK